MIVRIRRIRIVERVEGLLSRLGIGSPLNVGVMLQSS